MINDIASIRYFLYFASTMIYRTLGKTGLSVSSLGMGTMRLPLGGNGSGQCHAEALIRHAADRGINYFDTAGFYCGGRCESVTGGVLTTIPQDSLIWSAKNSAHQGREKKWTDQLDRSLSCFRRECLDIYWIHYITLAQWHQYFLDEGHIEELTASKNAGKFLFLGFSSHDTPEHVRRLIDMDIFDAILLPFNVLNTVYRPVMEYATGKGMGVLAMNPLSGGTLARSGLTAGDTAPEIPAHALTGLALQYVLSQPFIHCVLSGMDSHDVIDFNVAAVAAPRMTVGDMRRLEARIQASRLTRGQPCTGCGYCLPCPQGIPVPDIISLYNRFIILETESVTDRDFMALEKNSECCIACGICENRCPNHIPVATIMKEMNALCSGRPSNG